MNFNIITTPHFEREAKALKKRYHSFKEDLERFIDSLSENPMQGTEITPDIRKIRLVITSKRRGKSGGARVITYTICTSDIDGRVYLVDVYDKADYSTVDISAVKRMIADLEL
ncbi:MAG: addiction module toxin RelE [Prevotella sp.]|nr:addiction module toxin RelE [Prevotella sp.]